ncbi:hypothetical protein [Brevundimonas sp. GN22]
MIQRPNRRQLVCTAAILTLFVAACGQQQQSAAPQAEMNEEQVRGAKREGVLVTSDSAPQPVAGQVDYYEVVLAPYEGIELKYTAPEKARIAFSWTATGTVRSDLHAHPDEGGEALTESYDISDSTGMNGVYTAAFTGIHGWHWQNRTVDPVTLRLHATGGFTSSAVITDSSHEPRPLNPTPFTAAN